MSKSKTISVHKIIHHVIKFGNKCTDGDDNDQLSIIRIYNQQVVPAFIHTIMKTLIEYTNKRAQEETPEDKFSYKEFLTIVTSKMLGRYNDACKKNCVMQIVMHLSSMRYKYIKLDDDTHILYVHISDTINFEAVIDNGQLVDKFARLKKHMVTDYLRMCKSDEEYNHRKAYQLKLYQFIIYGSDKDWAYELIKTIYDHLPDVDPSDTIYII